MKIIITYILNIKNILLIITNMLFNTNTNDDCSICLSKLSTLSISSKSHTLPCKHTFHKQCIDCWFKDNATCPMCRANVTIIQQKVTPPPLDISINIPITTNQNTNRKTKNIIKDIIFFLYGLLILFHIGSCVYYYYQMRRINTNINNYIKTLNATELGDHSNNTFSEEILLISDIVYYFMFFLTVVVMLKNVRDCCCSEIGSCILLTGFVIANLIIHSEFYKNTNSYLSDKQLNFNLSYIKDLDLATLLYFSSYGSKLILTLLVFFKYHDYRN